MAGCETEEKSPWCHLDSESFTGDEGSSVGEEKEVDEEEVVRLEVISSAPLEVTSCKVLVGVKRSAVEEEASDGRRDDGSTRTVLMLLDFLCRRHGMGRPEAD